MALKRTKLLGDPTLLYCPACSKYKRVEDGLYKAKEATNSNGNITETKVSVTIKWIVICHDCAKELVRPEDL